MPSYTPMRIRKPAKPPPNQTKSAGVWLSAVGLTGAAAAAYALESVYGNGIGVLALYPAALSMLLLSSPNRHARRRSRVIDVGRSVPV
jgi:hypothetical protein